MGVATVQIRYNPSLTVKDMQDYHDSGHKASEKLERAYV